MAYRPAMSEEMKSFLQEGLGTYAPAVAALSEFRRQIQSRMQAVLDDFETQFSEIGLSVADLKLRGEKLDSPVLGGNSAEITLRGNRSAEPYSAYYIQWELDQPKGKQVWVGAWVSASKRADRDRLFGALQKQHSASSKTDLEQYSDGTPDLSRYCDLDRFYGFEETFRSLIEEWVRLLSAVGGIQPFLSGASAPVTQADSD